MLSMVCALKYSALDAPMTTATLFRRHFVLDHAACGRSASAVPGILRECRQ